MDDYPLTPSMQHLRLAHGYERRAVALADRKAIIRRGKQ